MNGLISAEGTVRAVLHSVIIVCAIKYLLQTKDTNLIPFLVPILLPLIKQLSVQLTAQYIWVHGASLIVLVVLSLSYWYTIHQNDAYLFMVSVLLGVLLQ